jgi:hypothetical protein
MNNIIVSDIFIDIFLNFNVISQVEKMKKLSRRELLILLSLAADVFSDDNHVVLQNFEYFKEYAILIRDSIDNEDIEDEDLKTSININISKIIDNKNQKIPNPLSEEEALIKRREIEINNIIGD